MESQEYQGYQQFDTPATQKGNPYYNGPSKAEREGQNARRAARVARRSILAEGTEGTEGRREKIVMAPRRSRSRRPALVVPISPDPKPGPTPIKTSKPPGPQAAARDARQARRAAQRETETAKKEEQRNIDSWDGPRPQYRLRGAMRVARSKEMPKSVTFAPDVGPARNAASALAQLKSTVGDGFAQLRGIASAPSGRLEQLNQVNRAVAVAIRNAIAVYTKSSNSGQTKVKRRSGARMRIVNPDRDYFCNT